MKDYLVLSPFWSPPTGDALRAAVGPKLPPTNMTQDEIDEWMRQYRALFDETPDSPPARHCHVDGHLFVNTGLLWSYCKACDEEGTWSRAEGRYVAKHTLLRRYDS